jgi:hypothetical protein
MGLLTRTEDQPNDGPPRRRPGTDSSRGNDDMSKTDTKSNNGFDPFDPMGLMKGMRDTNMDMWSKMMVEFVNTEAYAESTGAMLDAWLTTSGPLRKAMQKGMAQALAEMNLPSREDVCRISERLTHIEMRLDDMEAQIDEKFPSPSQ